MRAIVSLLAALVIAAAVPWTSGCVSGWKSAKPSDEASAPKAEKSDEEPPPAVQPQDGPSAAEKGEAEVGRQRQSEDAKTARPRPEKPSYEPPQPPPPEKPTKASLDLRQKEEVNDAALKFAKNVPGVKHIKTCYSKLYGGWYLLLYRDQDKKISLQQYAWNDSSKEWEIIYQLKELPAGNLEFHLKGEVADERCFILK
ncbi:MAG: hypothetical protein V2B18_21915 [Pseudomonadota bacterium]